MNKIDMYFIFSIGGFEIWRYTNELGFRFFLEDIRMNWKIYEWIVVQIFFGGEKDTNELEDMRMNWGSDFFEYIRMNWGVFWRKLWKFNK